VDWDNQASFEDCKKTQTGKREGQEGTFLKGDSSDRKGQRYTGLLCASPFCSVGLLRRRFQSFRIAQKTHSMKGDRLAFLQGVVGHHEI
jgi:hypothetical protein